MATCLSTLVVTPPSHSIDATLVLQTPPPLRHQATSRTTHVLGRLERSCHLRFSPLVCTLGRASRTTPARRLTRLVITSVSRLKDEYPCLQELILEVVQFVRKRFEKDTEKRYGLDHQWPPNTSQDAGKCSICMNMFVFEK